MTNNREEASDSMPADSVRMLEELRDDLRDPELSHYRTPEGIAEDLDTILAALRVPAGLPWRSDKPPALEDADEDYHVLALPCAGGDEFTPEAVDYQYFNFSVWSHWLPLSDIPLPGDEGWVDAGVWQSFADLDSETGWVLDEPLSVAERARYAVMVRKMGGGEK